MRYHPLPSYNRDEEAEIRDLGMQSRGTGVDYHGDGDDYQKLLYVPPFSHPTTSPFPSERNGRMLMQWV